MAKLSKEASKKHQQALDLVRSDKQLTIADRKFILENYHEGATAMNGLAGAFFTPEGLANDFSIEVPDCKSLIDLCAGIGRLSFHCRDRAKRIVCVEQNPEYAEVGKRVLPEAEWIVGDVFSLGDLGRFSMAISNPPFGAVKTGEAFQGQYTGANFEYKLIELASHIADQGAFIIPQASAPFRYSGQRAFREEITKEYSKFHSQTNIVLENNCGIDTSSYQGDWHGVSPICEIVLCEFERPQTTVVAVQFPDPAPEATQEQVHVALVEPKSPINSETPVAPQVVAAVLTTEAGPVVKPVEKSPTTIEAKAPSRRAAKTASKASAAQLSLFDAA